MVILDNLSRPLEAVLTLVCASLYAGGAWGSFRIAETFAYFLFQLAFLGLDRGIIWWHGQVRRDQYLRDLSSAMWIVLGTSVLGIVAFLGFSGLAVGDVKGMDLPREDQWAVAASIPLLALTGLLYQANLNCREMSARIAGNNIVVPLVMFGGAMVGRLSFWPWHLAHYFLLANASNALVATVSFLRLHRREMRFSPPSGLPRRLLSYGMPLAGSDLLSGAVARFDLALLGGIAGIRAVEVYNLVTTLGKSLQAIRQSFEGLLLSAFSRTGDHRLTPRLRWRFNHAVWSVGNILGLALLGVVFWGRDFLAFLHPQYRDGYFALVALTSFTYLNVYGDLGGLLLQGLGRSRAWGFTQLAGFGTNIACNLLWIPLWGALGGVFALGTSLLVQGTLCLLLLRRISDGRVWDASVARSMLGFGLSLAALCLVAPHIQSFWLRLALFLVSAVLWIAVYRRRFRAFESDSEIATDFTKGLPE